MVVDGGPSNTSLRPPSVSESTSKKRISIFGRDNDPPADSGVAAKPKVSLFISPKPKDRKKAFLTMSRLTQTFAVYPERPELIERSTLMKLEGHMGDEQAAGSVRGREAWWLVMPDLEAGSNQGVELLKWVIGQSISQSSFCSCRYESLSFVAIHDTFSLYGRPHTYTWDPRDPVSLMFAYPVGPQKDVRLLLMFAQ
jgi:CCR4-NOT transcriptional complex subunit CAF120